MANIDILSQIKRAENFESDLKEKFGLKYNPFPRSGIANIGESDEIVRALSPAYEETAGEIVNYMRDALTNGGVDNKDKYLSLIIQGEYGSGKTQTLMYIKSLFAGLHTDSFNPYVIYIDNPGSRLSELIGSVISQIGIENFRRYLWDMFLQFLDETEDNGMENEFRTRKEILLEEIVKIRGGQRLLNDIRNEDENGAFSWRTVSISYKYLLDRMLSGLKPVQHKEAIRLLKKYLVECFAKKFTISSVAEYFHDVVADNIDVTQSWDNIITGNVKNIDKREVYLLKAIVEIVKKYKNSTDFIILVDEFEEIAGGRVKDSDVDNYLRNLRSLIDREKNWCSVFAMNASALQKIKKMAAPLASRIGDRKIILKPLDYDATVAVVKNYLDLARIDKDKNQGIYPFEENTLRYILSVKEDSVKGSPRFIVKSCFTLLQRAAEVLDKGKTINADFAKTILGNLA